MTSIKTLSNWQYSHDLLSLSNNMGSYLTAYLEFKPEDGEEASVTKFCSTCSAEVPLFIPTKQVKEGFRDELQNAMRGAPTTISPQFKHFWFHARCPKCGVDLALMRS